MRRVFTLLCAALLTVAPGCAATLKGTALPSTPAKKISLKQVKEALRQRRNAFHDLRASARATLRTPDSHTSLRQVLLLQKGPYLRMETLGFFGQPSAYFTSNQEGINIYYPDQGKYFVGRPSPKNIFNLLGIDMDVADLVMFLTGNLPENRVSSSETLNYMTDEGTYLFSQISPGSAFSERLVWVNPENLNPIRVKFYSSETQPVLKVEYRKYREVNGYDLPTEVVITRPGQGMEITFHYAWAEVNKGISRTAFLLPIPEGVEIIELDK